MLNPRLQALPKGLSQEEVDKRRRERPAEIARVLKERAAFRKIAAAQITADKAVQLADKAVQLADKAVFLSLVQYDSIHINGMSIYRLRKLLNIELVEST